MTEGTNRWFRLLASPRTTLGLGLLLLALLAVGMFVPQLVPVTTVAQSYPSAWSQVVQGLDLHRVGTSWMVQLTVVLLVLNVCGLLLARAIGMRSAVLPGRAPDLEHGPVPGPADGSLVETLQGVSGWSTRLQRLAGDEAAIATRGLVLEGVLVALVGTVVLGGAWTWSQMSGTRGTIELMEGDDQIARSYFSAREQVGDQLQPWRPGFDMACLPTADGSLFGERECRLTIGGEPKRVTLRPGRDIEFSGLRLSLTGLKRAPDVAGFTMDLVGGSAQVPERARSNASVAQPIDITDGGERIATIILSGTSSADPIGALPTDTTDPATLEALSVELRPRLLLTLTVVSTETANVVWIGVTLILIGLLLGGILPSYRVVATRRGAVWRLSITARGLLARPEHAAERIAAGLAAKVKRP